MDLTNNMHNKENQKKVDNFSMLKFRAWDKNKNIMVYPGMSVDFQDTPVTSGDILNWFEDEDIMQSTGFKDKNEKEIFKADLIKILWGDGDYDILQVVEDEENAGLTVIAIVDRAIGAAYSWSTISKNGEIIGNIYENKELLV